MSRGKYRKLKNYFYSSQKKVTKIDKDGNESVVTISYKINESARFMAN